MIPSTQLASYLGALGISVERSADGGIDFIAPRGEVTPALRALMTARAGELADAIGAEPSPRWQTDVRDLYRSMVSVLVELGAPPAAAAEYAITIVHGLAHDRVVCPSLCSALELGSQRYIEIAQAHFGYPGFRSRADDIQVAKILIRSVAVRIADELRAESKAVQS